MSGQITCDLLGRGRDGPTPSLEVYEIGAISPPRVLRKALPDVFGDVACADICTRIEQRVELGDVCTIDGVWFCADVCTWRGVELGGYRLR